jgi:hypothetical protein
MAVFIGIMCSVWMTSPLMANAFQEFVGQSDRGAITVKNCVDEKRGKESFANKTELNVWLVIELTDGNGLDGGDRFDAFFRYHEPGAATPFDDILFSGVWSKIDERKKRDETVVRETYQLTPSGDLTAFSISGWEDALSISGWEDLLMFINAEAGDACLNVPPGNVYWALSDLVKGTLVVEAKEPKCANSEDSGDVACVNACGGGSCMKATVRLDVKAFMKYGDPESVVSAKTDWVRFRYKAKGYVILNP